MSVRPKSVTHVLGTLCYPCVRAVQISVGGADGIRTHDLLDAIEARSQLRHGPTVKRTLLMLASVREVRL